MRLGFHIGYWGLGLTAAQQLELVQEAERLGYDSVWTAEAYGSDAVDRSSPGWPRQTERIRLGSAILQMPGRSPAMTAMTAATLDQLSGGRDAARHRLERAAGRRGLARPALRAPAPAHARVRRRRADGAARASGSSTTARRSSCRCPTARARRSSSTIAPVQERIPIYIAAIGPKNTALDGRDRRRLDPDRSSRPSTWPSSGRCSRRASRAPAAARRFDDFDIAPTVNVFVDRRPRGRARRHAPVTSRSTSAAWARASRTSTTQLVAALRLRGRGARGAGPLPRRRQGGRGGRAARRADRRRLAVRAAPTSCASGSRSSARPASAR